MKERALTLVSCFVVATVTGCAVDATPSKGEAPEEPSTTSEEVGSTSQALFGSDACKHVTITITNSRDRSGVDSDIDVHYVEYYTSTDGTWRTEGLADRTILYGNYESWSEQTLEYTDGDLITKWRVHYKYKVWAPGANWSDLVYQDIDTDDVTCNGSNRFDLTVQ